MENAIQKTQPKATFWGRLQRLPFWQRLLITVVALPPILAGGTAAAYYLRLHQASGSIAVEELPLFPSPTKEKRYLILAPHCDDETLAVGGFIADATHKGAKVSVAFLTNGDGFTVAANRELQEVHISPADYVRFAERRQIESNRALSMLGVAPKNIYFLGYPDRGLRPMWESNWSKEMPYRSFYTGHTHSPYPVCFTKHTEYNGESLQNDLIRLLNTVKPTDIFVTHPADDHPDHSAASSFAQSALQLCATERHDSWASTAKLHYYIVHRGDWPLPQGKQPDANLAPPAGLVTTDTAWKAYLLSDTTRTKKEKALSRYVSQLNVCRRFLSSFIRENELFGEMDAPTVPIGNPGWTTVALDGRRDDVVRFVDPSADLTAIAVRQNETHSLTIRVSLRGNIAPQRLKYTLFLRTGTAVQKVVLTSSRESSSHTLEATVPIPEEDPACLWVAAETRYQGTTSLPMRAVDQIGYRPFLLPRKESNGNVSKSLKPGKSSLEAR